MLAKQGKHADSASLLLFVLNHPKVQMDDKITFNRLIQRFGYDASIMATAELRAKALELDNLVTTILI